MTKTADQLILDLEYQLLPIMETEVLDIMAVRRWVNKVSHFPSREIAKAIKWVSLELSPIYLEYKQVVSLKKPEAWNLAIALGEDLAEVKELKKKRRKLRLKWEQRPRIAGLRFRRKIK